WLRADGKEKVHDEAQDAWRGGDPVGGDRGAGIRGGDLGARQLRVLLSERRAGARLLDAAKCDGPDARHRRQGYTVVSENSSRSPHAGEQAVLIRRHLLPPVERA